MNYGLYLSASGVLTSMYRQDVLANNLANVATVGFKRDVPLAQQRRPEAEEEPGLAPFRNRLRDRIGGGALAGPQRVSLEPGPMQQTGNDLDVALTGRNAFFAVQASDPATGEAVVRLTRDGRFALNREGQLVTAADGHLVLDQDGRPIALRSREPATISVSGDVAQGGQKVARLQVVGATDPAQLVKHGQNLLWFAGDRDLRGPADDAALQPGHVEGSAVDSIRALMDLGEATRSVTLNSNMIRFHDQLLDRAINVFGRVS